MNLERSVGNGPTTEQRVVQSRVTAVPVSNAAPDSEQAHPVTASVPAAYTRHQPGFNRARQSMGAGRARCNADRGSTHGT